MPQRPILTITLNPALDLSGVTPRVTPGPKLRVGDLRTEPGGGGVNVARAIVLLGGQAGALVALGGTVGAQLAQMIAATGVDLMPFQVPGETRQSLSVTDSTTGGQFRFVLPGPDWDAGLAARCLHMLVGSVAQNAVVVLSGSQPPGMAAGFAQDLAAQMAGTGTELIVDTSGAALDLLVQAPRPSAMPAILRMDRAESEQLAGGSLDSAADSLDLAAGMVARGVAGAVILARGAEGSVLAAPGLRLQCIPPEVQVLSAVGAGDSFTGALALARARGLDLAQALVWGTAAAAAAVTTPGSALCPRPLTEALVPECRLLDSA